MDAGGDLDTSSGPISVRNVQGEVLTHSVSGTTRLAQVFGSVDAQTLSSDLDLDTIGGDRLVASVHHGRIDGRRVRARDIELTTTDGRIVLEAEAALHGHLVVSSLQGRRRCPAAPPRRAGGSRARHQGRSRAHRSSTQPDGWVESSFGRRGAASAALVEIAPRTATSSSRSSRPGRSRSREAR